MIESRVADHKSWSKYLKHCMKSTLKGLNLHYKSSYLAEQHNLNANLLVCVSNEELVTVMTLVFCVLVPEELFLFKPS